MNTNCMWQTFIVCLGLKLVRTLTLPLLLIHSEEAGQTIISQHYANTQDAMMPKRADALTLPISDAAYGRAHSI